MSTNQPEINEAKTTFWKLVGIDDTKFNRAILLIVIGTLCWFGNKMWNASIDQTNFVIQSLKDSNKELRTEKNALKKELGNAYDTIHKLYRQQNDPLDRRIIHYDSIINHKSKKK